MRAITARLARFSALALAFIAIGCATATRQAQKRPDPFFDERTEAIKAFAQQRLKPALSAAWEKLKTESLALKTRWDAYRASNP